MQYIKFMGWVIVAVLAVDVFGFMLWSTSGQIPEDGFYAGAITTNVLRTIIN